jgi:hypothetical protein
MAWRRPSRTIHCTVTLVSVPLVLHLSALSIALLLSFLYPYVLHLSLISVVPYTSKTNNKR